MWCDLAIIAGYTTVLLCGVAWTQDVVRRDLTGDQLTAGLRLAHAALVATWVAAFLDLVENTSLALGLQRWRDFDHLASTALEEARRAAAERENSPARGARWATDVKWVLLALIGLWLAVAGLVALSP